MSPDFTVADERTQLEDAIAFVRRMAEADPVRRAARLRQRFPAEIAGHALLQAELRSRAVDKFGADADRLWFTRDGLEQASRREVADHRAARFAAVGVTAVLDLCSGIGADALAFVRAGLAVTAIERDPWTAQLLAANLGDRAEVVVAAAEDTAWRAAESVFMDPARRTSAGRVFDPAGYSPPFDVVLEVLTASRFSAAKLAPGIGHDLVPAGIEAEWVSFGGGVKEAVLWSGGFQAAGCQIARRATVLSTVGPATITDADPGCDAVGELGTYFYEPDGAVIRAGLVQQIAELLPGGRRIDPHLAYLAADESLDTPFAAGFEVVQVLPFSVARLRSALRDREVGIVEIKKRGVDIDPAALRRELKPSGPNSITVLLARVGDARLAVLAERMT